MLDGRGHVRIVDFGLATPIARSTSDVRAGTPAYMAPEQLRGARRDDAERPVRARRWCCTSCSRGSARSGRRRLRSGSRSADGGPPRARAPVQASDPAVETGIRSCLEPRPGGSAGVGDGGRGPAAGRRSAGRCARGRPHAVSRDDRGRRTTRCAATSDGMDAARRGRGGNARRRVPGQPRHADRSTTDSEAARGARRAGAHDSVRHRPHGRGARHGVLVRTGHPIRYRPGLAVSRHAKLHAGRDGTRSAARRRRDCHGRSGSEWPAHSIGDHSGDIDWDAGPESAAAAPSAVNWSALFAEAGLDATSLVPIASATPPAVPHDTRVAWEGRAIEDAKARRVVGASLAGRPVYFDVSAPDTPPAPRQTWFSRGARSSTNEVLLAVFSLALLSAAA